MKKSQCILWARKYGILYWCGFHMLRTNIPSHVVTHKLLDWNRTKCIRPKPPMDFTFMNTIFLTATYDFDATLLYGVQLPSWRMISHHIHLTVLLRTSMIVHFYDICRYWMWQFCDLNPDYPLYDQASSSSIGTTTPCWVLACSTVVVPSQQEGFYRVLLPAAN